MKAITRFICLMVMVSLMTNSFQISSAVAAMSLKSNDVVKSEGQQKKIISSKKAKAEAAYAKLPLSFEANSGQADPSVKFIARGKGYTLFLASEEVILSLKPITHAKVKGLDAAHISLEGSNLDPVVEGLDMLKSKSNYLTGKDQSKWHVNVDQYSKVQYKQVYPGIDMVYYGNQKQLEYDFVVAPGASPDLIRMNFRGAKSVELDKFGNLIMSLRDGKMTFSAPTLYQQSGDVKEHVDGRFVMVGEDQVRFEVGDYDKSKELIIDPSLMYSTYLGTTVEDRVNAMKVDAAGNVYLTGQTAVVADLFPGTAASTIQAANAGGAFDAFVIKLDPAGAILWATYLGGAGDDIGLSIAVDASNIVYVSGSTTFTAGAKYPTTVGAYQAVNNGGTDGFLTAIAGSGNSLVYSTFIGGAGIDVATAITVDSAGNAYVTGGMTSDNTTRPATAGAYQTDNGGPGGACENAFIAKFNPAGIIQYFTYLGGSTVGGTRGNAITIDGTGNAFVTGFTRAGFPTFPSGVLPLARAFKLTIGGAQDAFVSKISPSGANLLYSSYLGGSGISQGTGIKLDSSGNVYVAGDTNSTNFPDATTDGVTVGFPKVGQTTITGNFDCFIFKIAMNATGHSDGVYCTFLGGSGLDHLDALELDSFGNAYVTGRTESTDFLTVSPLSINTPLYSVQDGTAKVFVTEIGVAGNTRVLNTYIGGVTDQEGKGIAVDAGNNIFLSGWTNSTDFPTSVPLYAANKGSYDGFVMKITATSPANLPAVTKVNPASGIPAGGTTVIITGSGFPGVNGTSGVKFGGVNATSYTVDSNTKITAIAPAHLEGPLDIVVTSPAGSTPVVPEDIYTYILAGSPAPVTSSLSPTMGPIEGGTTVVITGSGFNVVSGAAGVKFGTLNAASYVVNSDTKITAKTAAHTAGVVDVTITSPSGTSALVIADRYTYFSTPGNGTYFDPYIFPSPTTGSTASLAYFMPASGTVKIRVYNETGNLVDELQESESAGAQASVISVGNLSPGVYICLLNMNYDNGDTKKYSKIKFVVIH